MNDPLEERLRTALSGRAAQLPMDESTRVRAADYRPRTPHARTAAALASAGGAAGAAAIALFAVGLGAGTNKALADWSSTPTAPAAGQVNAAEAACTRLQPYPGEPALAGLTPKVADTRGPFSLLVYIDGRSNQACVVGPSGHASETTSEEGEEVAPAGSILWRLAGGGSGVEGHRASFVDGQVGEGVTAATLILEDNSKVKATISNGWFAAWWPGTESATAAQITTASGTTTQPLPGVPRMSGAGTGKASPSLHPPKIKLSHASSSRGN